MVEVLEFGATKYGAFNWQRGLDKREICESALRHMFAYLSGEKLDQESGLSHIGHMQCNLLFLAYMERMFIDITKENTDEQQKI